MLRFAVVAALFALCAASSGEHPLHEEFTSAGKQDGIEIWVNNGGTPVRVPAEENGNFRSGESYMILNTADNGETKDVSYWVGKAASQIKAGQAAVLAVHLRDTVKSKSRIGRELEGNESKAFRALFNDNINIVV